MPPTAVPIELDRRLSEASSLLTEREMSASMALVSPDDEEGKQLVLFLEAVSQYSSKDLADRCKAEVNGLKAMNQLITMVRQESSRHKQMYTDFEEIRTDLQLRVWDLQRNANKLLQHLQAVNIQFDMLAEIFLDLQRPLSDFNTQNDINLCVDILTALG